MADFEYIIVGSGAGGTLAARLARKGFKVFLLDAGGIHVPRMNTAA